MATATPIDEFNQYMEPYFSATAMNKEGDKAREKLKAVKEQDEQHKKLTGIDRGNVADYEASDEYKRAKETEDAYNPVREYTINQLEKGLAGVVQAADKSKLVEALMSTSPKLEGDSEVAKALRNYQVYYHATHPKRDEKGNPDKEDLAKAQDELRKQLPSLVEKDIETKTGNPELAKAYAKITALTLSQKTASGYLKAEAERLEAEIARDPGALAAFIKEAYKDKKDNYLKFAEALYFLNHHEEEKEK